MKAKTTYRTIPKLYKYRIRFHRTKNEFGTWESKFMGVEPLRKHQPITE